MPCCTWCCFAVMVETVVAAEADLALPPLPPIPPPPPPRPPEEQTAGRRRRFSMLVVVWLACRGNELLQCMCQGEEDLSTLFGPILVCFVAYCMHKGWKSVWQLDAWGLRLLGMEDRGRDRAILISIHSA